MLLLAGAQVLRGNMNDAVGVDIEGTSICGVPLIAGAMPSRRNIPSVLLSFAISRSPCRTWISTEVWLSAAVVKIWDFLVGMVVFLSMILWKRRPGFPGRGRVE